MKISSTKEPKRCKKGACRFNHEGPVDSPQLVCSKCRRIFDDAETPKKEKAA